jgi:hypothetical protein
MHDKLHYREHLASIILTVCVSPIGGSGVDSAPRAARVGSDMTSDIRQDRQRMASESHDSACACHIYHITRGTRYYIWGGGGGGGALLTEVPIGGSPGVAYTHLKEKNAKRSSHRHHALASTHKESRVTEKDHGAVIVSDTI